MAIEELRKKFIVSDDVLKARIESLIEKALNHCLVAEDGLVHISDKNLPAKDKIKLVLVARVLAAQLDEKFASDVPLDDLVRSTGIEPNQLRARANEVVKERFARSVRRGVYAANQHRIEPFLDSLSNS
jgi:hypothetical protein